MGECVTIGDATLYCGDCREIMAGLEGVTDVISDPPYEDELHAAIGKFAELRNDGKTYRSNKMDSLGFEGINASRAEVARLCVDISAGWVLLFTLAEGVRAWRDDLQSAGAKWDTTCFWVKPDAAPRFNGQGPARGAECMVTCWAGGGHRSWNAGGKRGVYTHYVNIGRQGEHPTEKPVALMSEIIQDFTKPSALVCDPFMGSGTTGVACAHQRRRFIGIERDAKWFDLACRRIEAAYNEPGLFAPVASQKPQQVAFDL